ncbi:hypothetical protein ACFO4O_07090 [Glaciecola siphonariae]|uniref:Secreted protein n=1 Tax=Glaciecola siphonariae TaxID=521012 RepID=A0ABV9LVC0_9ALTE
MIKSIFLVASLSAAISLHASASAPTDAQTPIIQYDNEGNVEVVEVQGVRPIYQYREFRNQKRIAFMNHFNEVVSHPDFKFRCERKQKVASRMKHEVCKNEFQWQIEDEIKERQVREGNMFDAFAVSQLGNKEADKKREELVIEIQTLLDKDSQLKGKYIEFKVADLTYKKMHKATYGVLSGYDDGQ